MSAVATSASALATGAFVWFAFRQLKILQESRDDSRVSAQAAADAAGSSRELLELSRKSADQQSLMGAFPVVLASLETLSLGCLLRVANRGRTPALDVDVQLWIPYFEVDLPLRDFVDRFVPDDQKDRVLKEAPTELDGASAYALSARLIYPAIPAQTEVEIHLKTPTVPNSVNVLVQVRDVLGRNYSRLDWLYLGPGEKRYRLSGDAHNWNTSCPRLDFDGKPLREAPAADRGLEVPAFLAEDLRRNVGCFFKHAISLAAISDEELLEDAGVWRQL